MNVGRHDKSQDHGEEGTPDYSSPYSFPIAAPIICHGLFNESLNSSQSLLLGQHQLPVLNLHLVHEFR